MSYRQAALFLFLLSVFSVGIASPASTKVKPSTPAKPAKVILVGIAQFSDFDGTSACGTVIKPDQSMVGIPGHLFNNTTGPCGRFITISAPNGKLHKATVQESCGSGCDANGLLLTRSLFADFFPLAKGTFEATWHFD